MNESFIGQISPAVYIVLAQSISPGKSRLVIDIPAGQPPTHRPESKTVNGDAMKICLGKKTCHSPVTVKKRVNPHQPMVGSRCRDELQGTMMSLRRIKFTETVEKRLKCIMSGRVMISHLHGFLTKFSRYHQAFTTRFRILHDSEFLRQLLIQFTVYVTEESPTRNVYGRIYQKFFLYPAEQ